MTIGERLAAGDLRSALDMAQARVKAAPVDPEARWLLAELLLLAGDAARADRILDAVVADEPAPAVLEFRRLLRAEVARQQVWREGRAPRFQGGEASPAQQAALRALVLSRAGDEAGAAAASAKAEALRAPRSGNATLQDGRRIDFPDWRDADDIMAPQLELLSAGGDHILVALERVASLSFNPTRRPRDLAWRRAEIVLRDGTEGVVYMPALYPLLPEPAPDALRLGRATEWCEQGRGEVPMVQGMGQRLFLAGEEAVAVADVATLQFH
jgi:type VI secretion system protein ImpE